MSSESVFHPKPTLVGRCSNCARHAAWVQEDMLLATSRRHISRIEQGHQVPSIRTIEVLAEQMQIHPLTLIATAYCPDLDTNLVNELLMTVKADFKGIISD